MKIETKIADFIIKFRMPILILMVATTVFFFFQAGRVKINTDLTSLLPQKHPYVKLHNEFRDVFGGANIIFIKISVKNGDIFNARTLEKVKQITEDINYVPGVDRYKIVSIAHRKVKNIKISDWGVESLPLMPDVPKTEEEMANFRNVVYSNLIVYGPLVSIDTKETLVVARLKETEINYDLVYKEVKKICDPLRDANTDIAVAGDAMIRGYIYSFLGETKLIFVVTICSMFVLLFLYSRRAQMTIIPVICALVSTIWGLGFIGTMGFELDPLILVIPLLITARIVSHSVQFNERYREEIIIRKDARLAAHATVEALFFPGMAGVVTDAAGIGVIYLIPIPILQNLSLLSIVWAMSCIFTVFLMNPIIFSYLSPFYKGEKRKEKLEFGVFEKVLGKLQLFSIGRRSWVVIGVAALIGASSWTFASKMRVGDVNPGTPLLWPNSQYNRDAASINKSFSGLDPMLIVLEGKQKQDMYEYENLHRIEGFQRYMERVPGCGGTESIVDMLKLVNMRMHEDHPKWAVLPHSRKSIGMLFYLMQTGSYPGDLDPYITHEDRSASLNIYFKDHRGTTINTAVAAARAFIDIDKGKDQEKASFKMAAGVIGTLAASNEEIFKSQVMVLFLSFFLTWLFASMAFRSATAGLLLIIPLGLANYFVFSYMGLSDIGLNINTLPVATIAIGIGVDYGIYFLSRLQEEYGKAKDLMKALYITLTTTGKAISFTALTVSLSVIFWCFSDIKFQAEMGLLLTIVTLLHLLGTLILLPALVVVTKPKFIVGRNKI